MKIDKFTEVFSIGEKCIISNFKTGSVDELDCNEYMDEIIKLKKRESPFSILDCTFEEDIINEMVNRGYISYYSDSEEQAERKWLFEKYKNNLKMSEKSISILVDSSIGKKWCFDDATTENHSLDKIKTEKIFTAVKEANLAENIDLWLNLKENKSCLIWIFEEAKRQRLCIKNIFTFLKNEAELIEIKELFNTSIPNSIAINIRYAPNPYSIISLLKNNGEIIEKSNIFYLKKHPFFCPFIYNTVFINAEGNIFYCANSSKSDHKIGEMDFVSAEIKMENGWSKGLFSSLCEQDSNCSYSFYCQKMCPVLRELSVNQESISECSIIPEMKKIILNKIKSMV